MIRPLFRIALSLFLMRAVARAVIIQLDYTYDLANSNFFGSNATAKAALEQAAADISGAIAPTLGPINTDVFMGTSGSTTATFDWSLVFTNPVTGAQETLPIFTRPADTIVLFVGMRPLTGSTLGQGGPGGAGVSVGGSGQPSQWIAAVDAAEAASNAVMPRGGGPVIGRFSDSITLGSATADYDLPYGAIVGNLWFDNDTDNNGSIDSAVTLNNSWHFNHTSSVAAGKNDFYSVALHEMLHAVGFGSSDTWDAQVSGTNWLGSNVAELNGGSGLNLLSADQSHAASGLMSTRLTDGIAQEVVMDPSLTVGTRKFLTQMDLAFLRDIGYVTIPEPGSLALLGLGFAIAGLGRKGNRKDENG